MRCLLLLSDLEGVGHQLRVFTNGNMCDMPPQPTQCSQFLIADMSAILDGNLTTCVRAPGPFGKEMIIEVPVGSTRKAAVVWISTSGHCSHQDFTVGVAPHQGVVVVCTGIKPSAQVTSQQAQLNQCQMQCKSARAFTQVYVGIRGATKDICEIQIH